MVPCRWNIKDSLFPPFFPLSFSILSFFPLSLYIFHFSFIIYHLKNVPLCRKHIKTMAKTLSARLTYRIMAVVMAMMVVITAVVHYFVREYMLDEAKERYLGILLENHQEMRRWLSEVFVAVENNVHDIERDIDDPDKMFAHMERIIRQNPSIVCTAMLFEPDFYPSKGRVFVPCARKDAADSLRVSRIDSTYHSYFYDEWFRERMQKDESCWTDAYFESELFAGGQERRLLTTYAAPIHDREGRPVALLCADLSLEELRSKMMEDVREINDQYERGRKQQSFLFIINREGIYVIHPEKQCMLTPFDENVGKAMAAHRGTCLTEVNGVMSRLYYRTIKEIGWVMVIVTPKDVILSNARSLNIIIILIMIVGFLAIYLFCRRQIKDVADPFAAQKAVMEHDLNIAHDIQMALLPQSFPDHSDIDLFSMQTPARDVGGDLYDYFVHNGRLVFCIGDVSGKGVPAALLMAVMRAMFRSEAHRADSAADIVEAMNRNLGEEYTGGDFVTMFVGVLDLTSGHLDYCNAGHEPPFIAGQLLKIKPNLPVGALPDWNYEGQEAQLKPGDMLFLYTDGLSEAMNTAGEQFGRKHVVQLVNEHCSETARQLVEFIEGEVHRHVGNASQSDDITLLAIKWLALPSGCPSISTPEKTLTLKPSMDDIAQLEPFIADVAQQAEMEGKEAKRLRLAVEEVVANIINYGEATNISLQAEVAPHTSPQEGNTLWLTIKDDGKPLLVAVPGRRVPEGNAFRLHVHHDKCVRDAGVHVPVGIFLEKA